MDPVLERVVEAREPTKDVVPDHAPLCRVMRIEGQRLEDVLQDESAPCPGHLTPFDLVEDRHVITAGEVAHGARAEYHVDRSGGPGPAIRGVCHECLDPPDRAAKVAHHID